MAERINHKGQEVVILAPGEDILKHCKVGDWVVAEQGWTLYCVQEFDEVVCLGEYDSREEALEATEQ